jgi:hypothetical protein
MFNISFGFYSTFIYSQSTEATGYVQISCASLFPNQNSMLLISQGFRMFLRWNQFLLLVLEEISVKTFQI